MPSATVIALDVSTHNRSALALAKRIGTELVLEKLLHSPSDELGIVLAGTERTDNPLAGQGDDAHDRFQHVTVACGVARPTLCALAQLQSVDERPDAPRAACDVVETLAVCAELLRARPLRRTCGQTIFFFTDASGMVRRKEDIANVLSALQGGGVALVVVGVDFTQSSADARDSWDGLSMKEENERALLFLCDQLAHADQTSGVISLDAASAGLAQRELRAPARRALARLVLSVGETHLAVQLVTRTLLARVPPLQKVASSGQDVLLRVNYIPVGEAQAPVAAGERVRALRYGRSLIPCTEEDREAMRIAGPRAMGAIGFVPRADVPPYIVTGATRVVLPLDGDAVGRRALASLVLAMLAQDKVLLVRCVARRDSPPVLGVCVPAVDASSSQHLLYFAPLPFADDVRHYRFAEYADVVCTPEEEALVESLVTGMTVSAATLRPGDSPNPELSAYDAAVSMKALQAAATMAREGAGEPGGATSPAPVSAPADGAMRQMEWLRRANEPRLRACAAAFRLTEPHAENSSRAPGWQWGRTAPDAPPSAGPHASSASSSVAPSTVAATLLAARASSSVGSSSSSSSFHSVATVPAAAEAVLSAVARVGTVDPTGSFASVLAANLGDDERACAARARAAGELAEVALSLLAGSLEDRLYDKCDDCVCALRRYCMDVGAPDFYCAFLRRLRATAVSLGLGDAYWQRHVVQSPATHPISKRECVNSSVSDGRAALALLAQDHSAPAPVAADAEEDELIDLIV